LGNIKIKGPEEMKDLENDLKESQTETAEHETETVIEPETETAETSQEAETEIETEEVSEDESGTDPEEEDSAESQEEETEASKDEKPARKERKLKWTRSAAKDAEVEISGLEEKIKEANDKYARLFAEFDNFRKRSEKEKMQRYDFGAKDMVERILPVIDNFERGLAGVPEDKTEDSFVKGMEMTYKQLLKALEDAGVKPIEAVGQEFNPDFHNAVMHIDDPEAGENIIVEEFQKGYMYKDHVVRYSMVKVAN